MGDASRSPSITRSNGAADIIACVATRQVRRNDGALSSPSLDKAANAYTQSDENGDKSSSTGREMKWRRRQVFAA